MSVMLFGTTSHSATALNQGLSFTRSSLIWQADDMLTAVER